MSIDERNRIAVSQYAGLMIMARKIRSQHSRMLNAEDMRQAGMVAGLQAMDRWTPGKASPETWFRTRAYGAMLDYVRSFNWGYSRKTHEFPELLSLSSLMNRV